MTEQNPSTSQKFGNVEVPIDWKIDPQGAYTQTTKDSALEFFNETEWESTILQLAAIEVRRNESAGRMVEIESRTAKTFSEPVFSANNKGISRPIFFVTGGFGSYFWATAKEVVVQEIKSSEQIQRDFSGDVPEGKFFIKRIQPSK